MSFFQILLSVLFSVAIGAGLANSFDLPIWALLAISSFSGVGIIVGFFEILAKIRAVETSPIPALLDDKATDTFLLSNSEYLSATLDAIKEPIIIIDLGQRLVNANAAARDKFNIVTMGVRIETFIRTPEILNLIEHVIADNLAREIELETHFPNRRFDRISAAIYKAGSYNRLILSIKDETNAKLADRMRADFLANAGHELRTPLASISGFIETLGTSARDDATAREKFLGIMAKQADRMRRLINDILALSRIELNEHLRPCTKIDICELLGASIATFEGLEINTLQRIKVHKSAKAIFAIGDSDEIQQVIINLLDNAFKYGDTNSTIEIWLEGPIDFDKAQEMAITKWAKSGHMTLIGALSDTNKNSVLMRIENKGRGIAKANMPRLAERFYRIDNDSKDIGGTGLGLAIVKHILNRHDGSLVVESKIDQKTAFSFMLPAA